MSKNFTPSNVFRRMLEKKEEKQQDLVIIIYGKPRSGKSSLGLQFASEWLKFYNPEMAKAYSTRVMGNLKLWKETFKRNFVSSGYEAIERIKTLETGELLFVDEGIDVANSDKMMSAEQSNLLQLLQKVQSSDVFGIFADDKFS